MISIDATKTTPRIHYNEALQTFEISGESYPENSFSFFEPVFAWFHSVLPTLKVLRLEVNIHYMNSSSTKCLLDLLDLLAEANQRGCEVSVLWFYEEKNNRALDLAQEFKEDFEFPFELKPLHLEAAQP